MVLSSVDYIKKAMRHIQIRHGGHEYHRAQFEIQFLQKLVLWWRRFYELMIALDDIFGAPVPLDVVKRVLTDTALDKLTNPQLVEELSPDHLVHAKREVLRSYRENGQVSFVDLRTYDQLGFEIGKDGWIQQITPIIQQGLGRCARNHRSAPPPNTELNARDSTNNQAQSRRHGRGRGWNRALNSGPY